MGLFGKSKDEIENKTLRDKARLICLELREIHTGQRDATPEERAAMRGALDKDRRRTRSMG